MVVKGRSWPLKPLTPSPSLLGRETKSLLIGEAADQGIVDSITQLAGHMPGVMHVNGFSFFTSAPGRSSLRSAWKSRMIGKLPESKG
jgi:hypothetical protein